MKYKAGNKGLTLLEIILSLALLGILAATFLPIFSGSFKGIMDAGRHTNATQQSKAATEDAIAQKDTAGISDAGETNISVPLDFSGTAADFTSDGMLVVTTKYFNGKPVVIKSFIPD